MTGTQPSLATPPGNPKGASRLFAWRRLALFAARVGIGVARWRRKPFKFGNTVIAVRHRHVAEVLARDLDFRIAKVNGPHFDKIGYHFILGMDRSSELTEERQVLYTALASTNQVELQRAATADITRRLAGVSEIDIVEQLARPVAGGTAQRLFGLDRPDLAELMDVARAIFGHCFLNTTDDPAIADRAKAAADLLTGWFDAEIALRSAAPDGPGSDMMGALLRGGASADLARRTLGGMLVGSIDTTATAVTKIMTVMMVDPGLLRDASRDAGNLPRTYGWCLEALRRWPQTPILARIAEFDTSLAGVAMRKEARVIMWIQAAMFDASAFPTPHVMRRTRPGSDYFHFGGGLHPCAGRDINAWQIAMIVSALLARRPVSIGKITWAGPFPAHLQMTLAGERP